MAVTEATIRSYEEQLSVDVEEPIRGEPAGKHLLSMRQLSPEDIRLYTEEAAAAQLIISNNDPSRRGISLLPYTILKAVMRQPSTRTGGSMKTAIERLGGSGDLISGMASSAEAKGETPYDSNIAFATQADLLGMRTKEDFGPVLAAQAIATEFDRGHLSHMVPVINLGDGQNEHPTQALGDFFTIYRRFRKLEGLTIAMVGDHERYRAFHSLMIGAHAVGMSVVAVESEVAPVPQGLVQELGANLERTSDLDEAMRRADILYVGRNPDEYDGDNSSERQRSEHLAKVYQSWVIDHGRIQKMKSDSIIMHPRPRRNELDPSIDCDSRAIDVQQMELMIPMRMAIIALHMGKSIRAAMRLL